MLTAEMPFQAALPSGEKISATVTYQVAPLPLDRDVITSFSFVVGKPTRMLKIVVKRSYKCIVREPEIGIQPAEEVPFSGQWRELSRASKEYINSEWCIQVPYPPVAARVCLKLNVFPAAASSS